MDDALADVAVQIDALKEALNKANELQEEANGIMRGLVSTLMETGQAFADLREELANSRRPT